MKKFIFTANVIAIIALVPAVIFGYMNHGNKANDNKNKTVLVKEVTNTNDDGGIFHLVKTF